jgi:hypothetical protein
MGKDTFELGGQEWPKVTWWRMKGMRFVYLTLWAAMITSATNGSQNVVSLKLSVADGNVQDTTVP